MFRCLGFRFWGSGFRVRVSGFRVQGLGFRVRGLIYAKQTHKSKPKPKIEAFAIATEK